MLPFFGQLAPTNLDFIIKMTAVGLVFVSGMTVRPWLHVETSPGYHIDTSAWFWQGRPWPSGTTGGWKFTARSEIRASWRVSEVFSSVLSRVSSIERVLVYPFLAERYRW